MVALVVGWLRRALLALLALRARRSPSRTSGCLQPQDGEGRAPRCSVWRGAGAAGPRAGAAGPRPRAGGAAVALLMLAALGAGPPGPPCSAAASPGPHRAHRRVPAVPADWSRSQPFKNWRRALDALDPASSTMNSMLDWMSASDDNITSSTLLASFGLPTEAHFVDTEDGYRLRLDRVANPGRQPVYLAHGMQTSSPSFALLGKDKAISSLLHEAGYDVWMVNYRGSHYSQRHSKYSARDEQFWRFSLHEHGVFDNTAAIDEVLRRTGFPSVLYAGHSMGCTSFMIMAAQRPEYQQKVLAAFLMAPAGPLHHHRSPLVRLLYTVNNVTQPMTDRLGLHHTVRSMYLLFRHIGQRLHRAFLPMMYSFTFTIVGKNPKANYYSLPFFFNIIPSGGSYGEVFHYLQNANPDTPGFRQYDHGPKKNKALYGAAVPPEYDLTNIRTPVHMYLAQNDILCTREDTDFLRSQFQHVVKVHYAEDPLFNHFDFFGSPEAREEVYLPIIRDMKLFEGSQAEQRAGRAARAEAKQGGVHNEPGLDGGGREI